MQKSVSEIFNNQNVFSIPNYQRDYAWGKSNVEDLWDDLQEAKIARQEGSGGHFLGTIVVARNPNNPEIYDIIDGQQRATTLFLLRYALNQKLSNPDYHKNNFFCNLKQYYMYIQSLFSLYNQYNVQVLKPFFQQLEHMLIYK